jgi:hypothetical protein
MVYKGDSMSDGRSDAGSDESTTSTLFDDGDQEKHSKTSLFVPFLLVLYVASL